MAERQRKLSDVLKRGYSDEELSHIYELGRFHLENGQVKRAETIFSGIISVAPEYVPAWLGLACVHVHENNVEAALQAARSAQRITADSPEVLLFLSSCLLMLGDYTAAGTYLGEVGERIQSGNIDTPNIVRFFRSQLARYEGEA